jgi:protein O-GlcNAc transferase
MPAPEDYARAIALYQSGQFQAAEAACKAIIASDPDFAAAYNLQGVLALDRGDLEAAAAALVVCVKLNPSDSSSLHNLGNALRRRGDFAGAELSYAAALRLAPGQYASLLDHGIVLMELGRTAEALTDLSRAVKGMPDFVEAHFQYGNALIANDRMPEAEASFRRALALAPDHASSLRNLSALLARSFKHREAAGLYERLVALEPANPEAWWLLAATLGEIDRGDDAISAAECAVIQASGDPRPLLVLARLLDQNRRYDEARNAFAQAIALDPGNVDARISFALSLNARGDWPAALAQYDAVLAIDPDHPQALILRCVHQIPVNYENPDQILERRQAFDAALVDLERWVECANPTSLARLAAVIDVTQPFLLTAQGLNDRDLMARYGALTCRVMAGRQPAIGPVPRAQEEPIRLGVVSGCFRIYTAWKILIEGYVTKLDPKRVQLFCYYTRSNEDANTRRARAHASRFVGGKRPLAEWIEEITRDRPHALLYPDLFMEPVTNQLAALRLAPVQIALGAHPETTGMPTIDYHISSDLMEPEDAQDHYTEKLIRLPNLATCFTQLAITPEKIRRADFGIPEDAVVYWCCQSTHKYLPQFDYLFGRIAERVERAFFLFLEQGEQHRANDVFHRRLEGVLGPRGQRYIMFPKMNLDRFYGMAEASDVFLDTIGWSGNTTVMESLTAALPVVTWPQALMRGRHAYAILRQIGVTETIATSAEEYVDIAARLGNDPDWRQMIAARMREKRHLAFDDLAPIRGFEAFLDQVCV